MNGCLQGHRLRLASGRDKYGERNEAEKYFFSRWIVPQKQQN
jgi:hypothetical protein